MHQLTGWGARSHLDAGARAARDPRGGKGVGLGSPGAGLRSQRGRQRVPSAPHGPRGAAGGCSPRRGCHPGEGPNGKLTARTPEIETPLGSARPPRAGKAEDVSEPCPQPAASQPRALPRRGAAPCAGKAAVTRAGDEGTEMPPGLGNWDSWDNAGADAEAGAEPNADAKSGAKATQAASKHPGGVVPC